MILHNKAWFLLCARHTKGDSVSYYTIKNITRFDTALKHYIIRRNSNIMPILSCYCLMLIVATELKGDYQVKQKKYS